MADSDSVPFSPDSPAQAGSPDALTAAVPPVGLVLGGYRVEAPIAGGMGVIFRAIDQRLGRAVVLKVLKRDGGTDAHSRFLREIRFVAALRHPVGVGERCC